MSANGRPAGVTFVGILIVSVISIIVGIFHLLFASGMRLNGLFEALFSLIILALLYSANARTFFARN